MKSSAMVSKGIASGLGNMGDNTALVGWYVLLIPGCPYMGASWWVRMKACLCFIVPVTTCVTITPYLSRDTTYCYRHCKGISRFPLLLHHPSPRPMPDR